MSKRKNKYWSSMHNPSLGFIATLLPQFKLFKREVGTNIDDDDPKNIETVSLLRQDKDGNKSFLASLWMFNSGKKKHTTREKKSLWRWALDDFASRWIDESEEDDEYFN